MQFEVREAYDQIEDVETLFQEYTVSIGIDLTYQHYSEELSALPGKYAEPDGRLYLAFVDNVAVGCVALRRFDAQRAEMKRLYVRPGNRGLKIGKHLPNVSFAKQNPLDIRQYC